MNTFDPAELIEVLEKDRGFRDLMYNEVTAMAEAMYFKNTAALIRWPGLRYFHDKHLGLERLDALIYLRRKIRELGSSAQRAVADMIQYLSDVGDLDFMGSFNEQFEQLLLRVPGNRQADNIFEDTLQNLAEQMMGEMDRMASSEYTLEKSKSGAGLWWIKSDGKTVGSVSKVNGGFLAKWGNKTDDQTPDDQKVLGGTPQRAFQSLTTKTTPKTAAMGIPPLTQWDTFAGGISGGGKNSFQYRIQGKSYNIDPITSSRGQFLGYSLKVFPGANHGWTGIDAEGGEFPLHAKNPLFRRADSAAKAAKLHFLNLTTAARMAAKALKQKGPEKKEVKGDDIKSDFYKCSDGLYGLMDAVGGDPASKGDKPLKDALKELEESLDKVHKILDSNYLWD